MRSRSPGKRSVAIAAAVGVGKGDVNQADGLFRGAAGGTGDSGDADAERRADAAANSLRESLGDLRADRAFAIQSAPRARRPRRS